MGSHRSIMHRFAGVLALAVAVVALAGGCDKAGAGADVDAAVSELCVVNVPEVCPPSPPRYGDVAPIFDQRCNTCHIGDAEGPWPLTDYDDIVAWASLIRSDLLSCSMPPADGGVTMTTKERTAILTWQVCNYPQ